jgi:hypothetical protein
VPRNAKGLRRLRCLWLSAENLSDAKIFSQIKMDAKNFAKTKNVCKNFLANKN